MNGLTSKQQAIVDNNYITVRKSESPSDSLPYAFFIGGTYYQQEGFKTELEAYLAGIAYVLNKRK